MTNSEKGKFCNSCHKQVIDFTRMSDGQVAAFFKKPSTGNVCGRFASDQLNKDLKLPRREIPWLRYVFQFSIPLFLTSLKGYSQGKPMVTHITGDTTYMTVPKNDLPAKPGQPVQAGLFKGRVVDQFGIAVPFATLVVKELNRTISTDSSGYFSIQAKGLANLFVNASAIGYVPESLLLIKDSKDLVVVLKQMPEDVSITMGMIMTRTVKKKKAKTVMVDKKNNGLDSANIISNLKEDNRSYIHVYPTLLASGNRLNIGVLKQGEGKTNVQVYNSNGEVVYTTSINMNSKSWRSTVTIPAFAAGVYFVRLNFSEGQQSHTTKIMIQ